MDTKLLSKKERSNIFSLFLNKNKLKFNEIEKALNIRSNLVSYHLLEMQKYLILKKKGDYYFLTENAESYIPIFSQSENLNPLPVILIALMNKNKILLIQRDKRPYKDYWGLIGGKLLFGEDIVNGCLRLIDKKSGINAEFISTNAVMYENVKKAGKIVHSFLLIFTKFRTNEKEIISSDFGRLKWFDLNKINRLKIIPSDRHLIENKLDFKIDIEEINIQERGNRLIILNKK